MGVCVWGGGGGGGAGLIPGVDFVGNTQFSIAGTSRTKSLCWEREP